jgi:hypothetical protein
MISALILVISIAAFCRLGLSYWRATLLAVALEPVSEEIRAAARLENERVTGRDFKSLASLNSLTPEGVAGLGLIGLYYSVVEGVGYLGSTAPAIAAWTEAETALCAQYLAVQIDRRLRASLALSESLGSY